MRLRYASAPVRRWRDLIARGALLAEALAAELHVLHVRSTRDQKPERKKTLDSSIQFADNLGATIVPFSGGDTARTTAAFIRDDRITQAIVGRSASHGLKSYRYYLAIQKFMSEAPHVDLHIATQKRH